MSNFQLFCLFLQCDSESDQDTHVSTIVCDLLRARRTLSLVLSCYVEVQTRGVCSVIAPLDVLFV